MKKLGQKYFVAAWTTLHKRVCTEEQQKQIKRDFVEYECTGKLPEYVAQYRTFQQRRAAAQRDRAVRKANRELRRLARVGCRSGHQNVTC